MKTFKINRGENSTFGIGLVDSPDPLFNNLNRHERPIQS